MTNREFYNAILSADLNDELKAFAEEAIAKMDARNEKRSSKPSKTALANVPVKEAIVNFLGGKENVTAADVAVGVEVSVQKASSLLRQMVADGVATVGEIKVPKKGKCKAYTLA